MFSFSLTFQVNFLPLHFGHFQWSKIPSNSRSFSFCVPRKEIKAVLNCGRASYSNSNWSVCNQGFRQCSNQSTTALIISLESVDNRLEKSCQLQGRWDIDACAIWVVLSAPQVDCQMDMEALVLEEAPIANLLLIA